MMGRSVLIDPAVKEIAAVDVADLRALQQKCDRVEVDIDRAVPLKQFLGDVRTLIRAARIITTDHLPARETAQEPF